MRTFLISVGCLIGAGVSSFLLYQDLQSRGVRQGKALAHVERFESGVRLKPAKSFIWSGIETNEELYRKDSLETPSGGGASVRFSDGTLLELGENSLIIVDKVEDLALNTLRGSLVVRTVSGGDSKITVDKEGKAKVEKLPVRLLKPEPLTNYWISSATKSVQFSWQANAKNGQEIPDQFVVQISPDRSFKGSRVRSLTSEKGVNEVASELAPGKWYWRVLNKDQPLTEPAQFRIDQAVAYRPVYPNAGTNISVWDASLPIQFRWSAPAGLGEEGSAKVENILELASDPDFKKIALTQKISAGAGLANLNNVPFGPGYWRIRSQYPEVAVTSPVETFTVEKTARVSIELGRPNDKASFEILPEVKFNWNAEANNVDYQWEIYPAAAAAGTQPLATARSNAKNFAWKTPAEGAYKWHVQAFVKDLAVGESAWGAFTIYKGAPIALRAPAKGTQLYYWTDAPKLAFAWTEDKLTERPGYFYQLEIAKDPDFKSIEKSQRLKTTQLAGNNLGLNGEYHWRVRVVDESGATVKTSDVGTFAYGIHPTLRAPASLGENAPVTWNPLETEKPPVLRWAPVEDAQAYEFVIKTDDPTAKVVVHQTTKDTSIPLDKKLKEGKYIWTATAIDKLNRKGTPTAGQPVEITYGAPLGAPEATSPEVQ